jgi:SH3 domain protein
MVDISASIFTLRVHRCAQEENPPVKVLFIIAAVWLAWAPAGYADTVKYVRDVVYVPLRSGPSIQHRILRNAESGTPITLIDAKSEAGYVHVRAADGTEGWMEAQFLMDEPIARDRLAKAEAALESARAQNRQLHQQLQASAADQSGSARAAATLQDTNDKLNAELARIKQVSSSAVTLDRDNRQLRADNAQLHAQMQTALEENARLLAEKKSRAFLNGAFAVALGVVIALLVPRLWPRRRRSEWA